jgi:hypothetical protein
MYNTHHFHVCIVRHFWFLFQLTNAQIYIYIYSYCYVCSVFILIVMYVQFCVSSLTVSFCVLFVCKCVLYYCHPDIGALFDYPNCGFLCFLLSCKAKCQGITRKDGARSALPKLFLLLCMFRSLYSVYCLRVNVYCTAATGCQPICS